MYRFTQAFSYFLTTSVILSYLILSYKYKLDKHRSRLETRKNFFSQRVVNNWNSLSDYIIEAESVNSFKNRYDKYVRSVNGR